MILNKLSVKFQFAYKNTPSFSMGCFICNKRLFFGRRQSNFASLSSKFASQKLPLPYLSFFVLIIDFSSIKKQPVGDSLGAPALMQNNSLSSQAPPRPCSLRGLFRSKMKFGFSIYFRAVVWYNWIDK